MLTEMHPVVYKDRSLMDILEKLRQTQIVPVVVLNNADAAISTAKALLDGGIDIMEITFRTQAAADAIRSVAAAVPEMTVGAGTVVTLTQCKQAISLGAQFIVCPGYDEAIVQQCQMQNIPIIPGCITPTEIMMAQKQGLQILKFFPADSFGGIKAMKALTAPFGNIKFIPTGGINEQNLVEFLCMPFVYAVGGSWLCSSHDIENQQFEKITQLCQRAVNAVKNSI